MGERLKGKAAVVTGGAGGVGAPICRALAAEGARLVINDVGAVRDGSGSGTGPVDNVVSEIKKSGGMAIANCESVVDFAGAERLIKTCVDSYGRIDILVNVHGNLRDRMIWNMTEDEWDSVINIHLKGTFNTCRHACVRMREQRHGRIINVTSVAWRGATGHVNYSAAKGGVVSLTRAVAREMGKYGVTANCFDPLAATRMTLSDEVVAGMTERYKQGIMTKEQLDEILNLPGPEYVPPFIVYLASDGAANINGRVFHVEKGRIALYSEPVEEKVIYKTEAGGMWTVDELEHAVPNTLLVDYVNIAPSQETSK